MVLSGEHPLSPAGLLVPAAGKSNSPFAGSGSGVFASSKTNDSPGAAAAIALSQWQWQLPLNIKLYRSWLPTLHKVQVSGLPLLSPLALCGYVCLLSGVCLTSENVHAIIGGTNLDKWKCQRKETNASKAASCPVRQSA